MSEEAGRGLGYTRNREMSIFGYVIAVIIAVLLIPLVPVILVGYLILVVWRALTEESDEPQRLSWRARSRG